LGGERVFPLLLQSADDQAVFRLGEVVAAAGAVCVVRGPFQSQ
jgi:hypothetical protein